MQASKAAPPGEPTCNTREAALKDHDAHQPPQSSSNTLGAHLREEISKLMNWKQMTPEEFAAQVLQMSANVQATKDHPKSPMAAMMHECMKNNGVEVAPGVYLNPLTAPGMAEMLPKMVSNPI